MLFFFFNDTAPTEIYTLSLHDALPIYSCRSRGAPGAGRPVSAPAGSRPCTRSRGGAARAGRPRACAAARRRGRRRSEEHTSELQSRQYLVCRLLLEKKKTFSIASPSST